MRIGGRLDRRRGICMLPGDFMGRVGEDSACVMRNFSQKFTKKGFTNQLISGIILKVVWMCACSSVDRALASGARCVGSIPIRRMMRRCFIAYAVRHFSLLS